MGPSCFYLFYGKMRMGKYNIFKLFVLLGVSLFVQISVLRSWSLVEGSDCLCLQSVQ